MQNMSGGKTALGLDNNIGALVCYLNICLPFGLIYSIIVLVTDKTNKLPRFHAVQSLLLMVAAIVVSIPLYFLTFMFLLMNSVITSLLGAIMALVLLVFCLGLLFFVVMSAIKAFKGEVYKIPVIGNYADNFSN